MCSYVKCPSITSWPSLASIARSSTDGSTLRGCDDQTSQYSTSTPRSLACLDQLDETHFVVHDVIVLAAASFVFLGTVLRMWDFLADADRTGEFAPRSSREEMHC